MKKRNLLLSALFLGSLSIPCSSAFAQNTILGKHSNEGANFIKANQNPNAAWLQHIRPLKNNKLSLKPTATQSRLNSFAVLDFDGVFFIPQDSTSLHWTGTNNAPFALDQFIANDFFGMPHPGFSTPKEENTNFITQLNVDSIKNYAWDNGPGNFGNGYKTLNIYDPNGNLATIMEYAYIMGAWQYDSKTIFSYDAGNNVTSEISQQYIGGVWTNQIRKYFDYTPTGELAQLITSTWIGSSWVNDDKYSYQYDSLNNLTESIFQNWNSTSSAWENYTRYEYGYDTKSQRTSAIRQGWNSSASQWSNTSKDEYNYDAQGNNTSILNYSWDGTTWREQHKANFSYDNARNNTKFVSQSWNGSAWDYDYAYEYNYTGNIQTEVFIKNWNPSLLDFDNVYRIAYKTNDFDQYTQIDVFEWDGAAWATTYGAPRVRMHYQQYDDGNNNDGNTSIKTLSGNDFVIYPNPATNVLNINANQNLINKIRIVDLSGKVVFETKGNKAGNQVAVPTTQLSNGSYILQLTSGNKTGAKLFNVQH